MKTRSFCIVNQIVDYSNGFHAQIDIPKRQNYGQNRSKTEREEKRTNEQ